MVLTRRFMIALAGLVALGAYETPGSQAAVAGDAGENIDDLIGGRATESDRIRLLMPEKFPNGYTVPLAVEVVSPMTATDHVKSIRIIAPKNPITPVVQLNFNPGRSAPRVSMRIRLAEPQFVLAVAEMNDGSLLMTKAWCAVATNGCA